MVEAGGGRGNGAQQPRRDPAPGPPLKRMELLERDAQRHALEEAFRSAVGGSGRVVLVTGEAGIGKTALVRDFLQLGLGQVAGSTRL